MNDARPKITDQADWLRDHATSLFGSAVRQAKIKAQVQILAQARERIVNATSAGIQTAKLKILADAEPALLAAHRLARDNGTGSADLDIIVRRLVSRLEEQTTAAAENETGAALALHQQDIDAAGAAVAAEIGNGMADALGRRLDNLVDSVAKATAQQNGGLPGPGRAPASARQRP
jgi:hypothetical protein